MEGPNYFGNDLYDIYEIWFVAIYNMTNLQVVFTLLSDPSFFSENITTFLFHVDFIIFRLLESIFHVKYLIYLNIKIFDFEITKFVIFSEKGKIWQQRKYHENY